MDSVIGGTIESWLENIFAESIKRKSDLPPSSSNLFVSGSLGNGKKSPFLEGEVALPRLGGLRSLRPANIDLQIHLSRDRSVHL